MGKRAAKAPADTAGKVVEIVTRTTERRTGEDDEIEINGGTGEGGEFDPLDSLDDLGDSDARLEIRRTSPAEFAGYVGTYSRDGWSPDRLMEEWGGGKFTIRVRNPDGTMRGQRHVTIAGKPRNKETAPAPAPVAQQAAGGDQLAQILSAIQASNVAAREATAGQISLLTTLLTSLINKEAPKPAPQPDPLAILEKAANILKPRGSESEGAMTALLKGIDLGRSMAEGGGEPGMASVFMEGIKTIKEAAVISQSQPRPAPQRRIAAPPPGSVPAAAPVDGPAPNKQEQAPMSDTMKQMQWIRQQAAFLVVQAKRKKNPELYAELFLDNLPAFLPEEVVHEQMKDPTAVQKLGVLHADVLQFPEWFEEFRAAVVAFIEAPDEDDAAAATPLEPLPDSGNTGPSGDAGGM